MRQRIREVVIGGLLVVCALLAVGPVFGQGLPDGIGSCLMVAAGPDGEPVPAPVQATDIRITVRGPVARATVEQEFTNPGRGWVEGIYVFPLPPEATVDSLHMRVGDRVIAGRVMEREAGRKVYEQARREGKRASLVERERPNIFTTSVANIGPGDRISIRIGFQWLLTWRDERYEMRFPTVVGPRYIPGGATAEPAVGTGWAPDTNRVPDASRITPPLAHPDNGPVNPITLDLDLDLGVPLDDVRSSSHALTTEPLEGTAVRLGLVESDWADRDIVLEIVPSRQKSPEAVVLTQDWNNERYVLLMVMPPRPDLTEEVRLPREMIVVIDCSGSMGGRSIRGAKAAVECALDRLGPDATFNLIAFNNTAWRLFPESRQAFPAEVDRAKSWVHRLGARGGTRMLPALRMALEGSPAPGRLRQVVFVTDGCVGNEAELLTSIEADLGDARLFTVGIGSAPNGHFMRRAAESGRGTFTFISQAADVAPKMGELLEGLESPVMSDLEVEWPDPGAEMCPARIGDLYVGEPLVAVARLTGDGGEVRVEGLREDAPWVTHVSLDRGRPSDGLHRLWAQRRIRELLREARMSGAPLSNRRPVVDLAVEHGVLTPFTSLVAVDVTPARPEGERLTTRNVPTNLPAGWSLASLLGLPHGATGFRLELLVALILLAIGALLWRAA